MEEHVVKVLETELVTHNVKRFVLEKPANYNYIPGQATEISINTPEWKEERRPFTFTSLNEWDHLEFTIKIYSDHPGVTKQLGTIEAGDELLLHDVFGAIHYAGEGTFIAGGAGVTPFIAILRQLEKDRRLNNNRLIFSNRTEKDIILKDEFSKMLGNRFINTLTDEQSPKYEHAKIDRDYLRKHISDFTQYFYICGPDPMVEGLHSLLIELGAPKDKVIIEQF
ncbi:MAG TPA: FAD-binding oxidoreductase [Puia sp.]|nr:FAD-binding oxidoreductase [Puia sp.]